MKETPRAQQAFNDYLNLGSDRSLEKLADSYRNSTGKVPTHQLSWLKRWSQQLGWQSRLAEIAAREQAAIEKLGIADRQNRVNALDMRAKLMEELRQARAGDMGSVAGGSTGLLVRQYKKVGTGRDAEMVEEYAFDAALFREMREHERQAAVELGQWEEKSQVAGTVLIREVGADVGKL